MVDLHAHILYGLDDGPNSLEETMAMLRIAVEEGIHTMAATPHFIHGANAYDAHQYQVRLDEIQEKILAESMPITLLPGNEMMLDEWTITNYQNQSARTLADSSYALLEFPILEIPRYSNNILDGLLKEGLTPLIAHPERYPEVQEEPGLVGRFIYRGCLMQVNSGSITGIYGKAATRTAKTLIQHHMVHLVASDCHTPGRRSPRLKEARNLVQKWMGTEVATQLFETNPAAVLNNQSVDIVEPLDIERPHGALHKMKGWLNCW